MARGGVSSKFAAFVSYSHVDAGVARALQEGLERLARPWWRRRGGVRVFRDSTGLAVNPDLWSSIVAALGASEHLIVVCSPAAAGSPWVDQEVAHWVAARGAGSVLLVQVAGELEWDEGAGRFDAARSTCLCPALVGAFAVEPRHLDLRWAAGRRLRLGEPQFRDAVAELAAPLHGRSKAELLGVEARQWRRRLELAVAAGVLLAVAAVAAVGFAVSATRSRSEARRQRDVALAGRFGTEARLESFADPERAAVNALQAWRLDPDSIDTHAALLTVVQLLGGVPRIIRDGDQEAAAVGAVAILGPHRDALAVGNRIEVIDVATGAPVVVAAITVPGVDAVGSLTVTESGDLVAVARNGGWARLSVAPLAVAETGDLGVGDVAVIAAAVDADRGRVAVALADERVLVVTLDGSRNADFTALAPATRTIEWWDGTLIAGTLSGLRAIDVDGEPRVVWTAPYRTDSELFAVADLAVDTSGQVLGVAGNDGAIQTFDRDGKRLSPAPSGDRHPPPGGIIQPLAAGFVTAGLDSRLILWNTAGAPVQVAALPVNGSPTGLAGAGDRWLVGAADGAVVVNESPDGRPVETPGTVVGVVPKALELAGTDDAHALLLWLDLATHVGLGVLDVETGTVTPEPTGRRFDRTVGAILTGGNIFAAIPGATLEFLPQGGQWRTIADDGFDGIFPRPGGGVYALARGGLVVAYAADGTEVARRTVPVAHPRYAVYGADLSPDGTTFAVSWGGATIAFLDAGTLEVLGSHDYEVGAFTAFAFLDARRLAVIDSFGRLATRIAPTGAMDGEARQLSIEALGVSLLGPRTLAVASLGAGIVPIDAGGEQLASGLGHLNVGQRQALRMVGAVYALYLDGTIARWEVDYPALVRKLCDDLDRYGVDPDVRADVAEQELCPS